MSRYRRWLGVALLLLLPTVSGRGAERFSLSGYYKSFVVDYELPSVYIENTKVGFSPLGSVTNRVRFNGRYRFHRDISFSASYDIGPIVQDRLLFSGFGTPVTVDPFRYRVDDVDPRLYPDGEPTSFAVYQNLDRAFFEIRTPRADFYIGRQPIAWGSARTVNPTDILAPYSYETLDTEDRVGVDAVRARIPLGSMGELDVGYVFGQDFESANSAAYFRAKTYTAQTDISLLAIGFRENLMFGVDLTRSIGGAGVWLEAAHTFADALTNDKTPDAEDYFRATLGLDYSLGDNTYGFAEYHFNQAGSDETTEYPASMSRTAFTEGSSYLLGRHYLIPGVIHQITPLLSGAMELLCNLSDCSAYLAPSLEYNFAENVYLAGGAFVGVGPGPSLTDAVGSEFGLYPCIFYGSFRVYF